MTRRDLLRECNDQKVPVEDFELAFCKRCYQPECPRSIFGTMKFDQRVATWHERLFTQVPRMDPSDPRVGVFGAKLFQMVEPPIPGVTSGWDDPRDIKTSSVSVPIDVAEPQLQLTPTPEPLPPRMVSETLSQDVILINTPNRSGIMLAGGASRPAPKTRDAWDAPVPLSIGETLVKKGATIRFGGGVQTEETKAQEGESK